MRRCRRRAAVILATRKRFGKKPQGCCPKQMTGSLMVEAGIRTDRWSLVPAAPRAREPPSWTPSSWPAESLSPTGESGEIAGDPGSEGRVTPCLHEVAGVEAREGGRVVRVEPEAFEVGCAGGVH